MLSPSDTDVLCKDRGGTTCCIILLEQGDDAGSYRDSGLVAVTIFGRILFEDDDIGSVAFQLQPLQQPSYRATNLRENLSVDCFGNPWSRVKLTMMAVFGYIASLMILLIGIESCVSRPQL